MRVATFNILHGQSVDDGCVDLDRLGDAVASLDVDVLALQEVDRGQQRSGGADLATVAAEAVGAVDHRFVAAMVGEVDSWGPATGTAETHGPAYGIALLSRHPVRAWRRLRLPSLPFPAPMWFPSDSRPTLVHEEPRMALAAAVEAPGGLFTVVNTHLSFVPWWNGRQLRTLSRAVRDLGGPPHVLVGDFNMGAARAGRATGMTSLVSAPTFPADAPRQQLDHVLADVALTVVSAEARRLPLSDHRALLAEVEHGGS
jgi:endonuclease/exonuclease/phosphatase family metal-dependent hydrolase